MVGLVPRAVERPNVGVGGVGKRVKSSIEVRSRRPVEVPTFDLRVGGHACVEQPQSRFTTVYFGDRPVHSNDRGRPDSFQHSIQLGDLGPVGTRKRRSQPMQARDCGLQLIRAWATSSQDRLDKFVRFVDRRAVPERPVLIGEQHDLAELVESGPSASVRGKHQLEEADRFAFIGHQRHEGSGQPNRLVGQVDAGDRFRCHRRAPGFQRHRRG